MPPTSIKKAIIAKVIFLEDVTSFQEGILSGGIFESV
jgi:hypothetical protein